MKRILNILYRLYRFIRKEKGKRFYEIDGFMLDFGYKHNLSILQKYNPMYDRFIPFLTELASIKKENTNEPHWIIDIGANVGDTLAAMLRHTNNRILCIEPTKDFFSLLKKNVESFEGEFAKRVELVRCYIAFNPMEQYVSNKINGTAIKMKSETESVEAPTETLIDVIEKQNICVENIDLIKVDTDGYDSECILSMGATLSEISPLLYWENQIDTIEEFDKYKEMIEYINDAGYERILCLIILGIIFAKVI